MNVYPNEVKITQRRTVSKSGDKGAPQIKARITMNCGGITEAQALDGLFSQLWIKFQAEIRENWNSFKNQKEITFNAIEYAQGASPDAIMRMRLAGCETQEEKIAALKEAGWM